MRHNIHLRLRWPTLGLLALIFVAAFAAAPHASADPATAPAKDSAGIPKVLKVGTEGVYAPFSYHDSSGKLVGFDVDLMRAIGKRMGVKVKFVETPWDSMFAALKAHRFDVVANEVTVNPARTKLYALSTPYVTTGGVVVTRSGDHSIHTLKDLNGKTAAESITSNWSKVAKSAGAEIKSIQGMTEAMTLLRQGRVDAVVNDELAVKSYLATTKNTNVKIVSHTRDKSRSAFAALKGSPVIPAIDKQITAMRADGSLKRIYDKYFSKSASTPKPAAAQQAAPGTWQLIKDNAWPMLKATITGTIPLTAISFVIGLVIALLVALARMSSQLALSSAARFYISIIRGTPLLVQLFIIFYAMPQAGLKIDPFPAAVVAFSLNVGGYAAEIIRSAIQSISSGQREAAATIGMDYRTTLRRVILPQAARTAVPPLSNTLISLVKDTSLASTILVTELLRRAQVAAAPTYEFFAMYGVAALYYWVICMVLSFAQGHVETRMSRFVAT